MFVLLSLSCGVEAVEVHTLETNKSRVGDGQEGGEKMKNRGYVCV